MANKQAIYTFMGINQDVSRSKHLPQFYFEGQHIKLLSTDTQSTGAVANEKGNLNVITLPNITINATLNEIQIAGYPTIAYKDGGEIDQQIAAGTLPTSSTTQQIIGHTTTRNSIIIFSTDGSMDCIWEVSGILDGVYDLTLLYLRNFNFSIENPIQAIFNYENTNIQKIYWVDSVNQIRFMNIRNDQLEGSTPLIDIPLTNFDFVGEVSFSQPTISSIVGGGSHTAGMIQYAYNLYRLNSSQTKISPLSELVPLDKGENQGGGAVNEAVGATPIINIADIDTSYTHIKVYAIKYTSYNELPSVNLIDERELNGDTSITIYDDGSTIESISLDEFLFLGSDPVVPKHIESKDNRLFLANIKDSSFDIPDELDCRAYAFPINSTTTRVWDSPAQLSDGSPNTTVNFTNITNTYILDTDNDAINLQYDTRKYQYNSSVLGGSGKYITYEIVQKTAGSLTNDVEDYRFLKDREIYRIGIQFYNNLGQVSPPKWIADFKAPAGNLQGNYNTLKVSLTAAFTTWLNTYSFEDNTQIPIGYKIIRADRTSSDRTILCQGPITGMMVNAQVENRQAPLYTTTEKQTKSTTVPKIPNVLTRTFQYIQPLQPNLHLRNMQDPTGDSNQNRITEIAYDNPSGSDTARRANTFQYTAMYQMYSPEIMFDQVPINSSTKFNVVGGMQNTYNAYWGKEINIESQAAETEGQCTGKISPHASGGTEIDIIGDVDNLITNGLISDTNGSKADRYIEYNQWYREFTTFSPASNVLEYFIYRTPELTVRGQGRTVYGNNTKYTYLNTLEGFLSDGEGDWAEDGSINRAIISVNTQGAQCITFVADSGSQTDVAPHTRPLMENLYSAAGIGNTNVVLISELIRPSSDVYFGNIYSGNSFEDKSRTSYLEIGEYTPIGTTTVQIDNAGDTYVQNFKFERLTRTDTDVYQLGINQMAEIVNCVVETTVDLKNRNDVSQSDWQSTFHPLYDEYHQYNRVYSQQPTLVENTADVFNFQKVKEFDTRIQATKLKTPNETIDSWSDVLVDETLDLNGKYGPINNIVLFNDNLFAFQDEAISRILINPRVQVQGTDGTSLELGTGGILYDFEYLTSKSGSINKWGMVSTKTGIYYYDALNKAVGVVPTKSLQLLSDEKGLHTYFNNNYDYNSLLVDNPYLGTGVVFGYDNYNSDIYITLLQGNKSFTRCYNEAVGQFIDKKLYLPSAYIYKGEKLLTLHPDNNKLYEQYAGEYNQFFDTYQSSLITLMLNPESNYDTVFNTIDYNSEVYLNDIDQPDKTLTHIRAYNEYQDSGRIQLVNARGNNLRRKFREWKASIPRQDRNRIRNTSIFLTLEFANTSDYKFILHDVTVNYTV